MRRLILLRHTKSDWPAGTRDQDRPLAERGIRAAAVMGRIVAQPENLPDLALVSTAVRTTETWRLARAAAPALPEGAPEPLLYEAAFSTIAGLVRAEGDDVHRLCLVGHNPGLELLAADLIGTGDRALRARLSAKYPTGGLVVIDCAITRWSELTSRCGTLVRFVAPRDLDPEAE